MTDELGSWDAVETAERVRAGDVSAREVIDAAIARAEAAADLNAVVTAAFDRARRLASDAGGPLGGVPTFIKDLAHVEGLRTAWGSAGSGHYTATRTDPFPADVEAVGAVTLGKSATPELGLTGTTEPVAFGPCRNPWDRERSVGGSSGGAAALVAAGVVPIAHASDGGGSIRIPAACCGLVGLKVSRGRRDMAGSKLLPVNVAVDGVVSRTVRDTVAFWNAIEERNPPRGLGPIGDVRPEPARPLRVGLFTDSTAADVDPEVVAAVEQTGRNLEALGHRVEAITNPAPSTFNEDFVRYWGLVAYAQHRLGRVLQHPGWDAREVEDWTRGLSGYFTSELRENLAATRRLMRLERDLAHVHHRWDVLLGPTLARPAAPIGFIGPDVPFEENRLRLIDYIPFTPLQNALGAPAISLPLGRTEAGLPIGVMLAAARGEDRLLLSLARQLEAAHPWPTHAPS